MATPIPNFPALPDPENRRTVGSSSALRDGGSREPMSRVPSRLATWCTALLIAGCFSFTAGVEEPDLAAASTRIESRIHPGRTTRQEVRALLGSPIFDDSSWGIELYRSDQSDVSTEWMVVLMVPVPGWTEVREYRLYPLIVYSSAGVVQGFGAGQYAERHRGGGAFKLPGGTSAEVLGFTLAVVACDEPACLWLVAPADRSVPLLRARPAPGTCVINIAKPDDGIEIQLDGQPLLRSIGSSSGGGDSALAQPWFARIPLSPGAHTVRATPTEPALAVAGELRRTIDCRGDQWFAVRVAPQFQKASSFFSRAQLTGDIDVRNSPDAIPDDARLILFHGGRSLAAVESR